MNRSLIAAALCGLCFAANAQTVSISADAGDRTDSQMQRDNAREDDRFCLRETGSRITRHGPRRTARDSGVRDSGARECVSAHGRTYTRDDLDRTGAIDIADALRRLDTSIY